ncbi:MAG: bifunctional molybdenum cofactor biosynthesis protein MoaC/MoaB [Bacteroidetes bacterium]|nr:bifunctional molybdenum cofactor biosynthesis protein MoaC/MoaB [Bacteroidota bacterium]
MNDITHKITTLRSATAEALVRPGKMETIEFIKNKTVPKGDVYEFSRAAALLAVKNTAHVIPDCHPLPVESCEVDFSINNTDILIRVEVKAIYRTGVEVEAMYGAAVAALTIYDMLKPIDKNVEIQHIKLLAKKGGKSDYTDIPKRKINAMVVVCSDTISKGNKEDKAGKTIIQRLEQYGITVSEYAIIPDEPKDIARKAELASQNDFDLLIYTGGTGLSKRDVTPETILPMLDREVPGIMEAARKYGQERMPYAMVSRGVAGYIENTLILALPGSTRGAEESMDALFPYVLHLFSVADGGRHDA